MAEFRDWFKQTTGHPPHDWQEKLATAPKCRNRCIRIPTGLGKSLAVVAAWAWHRLVRRDEGWPLRLVIVLPMRVLVEQTEQTVRGLLDGLGLLWDSSGDHIGKVGVHLLMGGESPEDWHLFPEFPAVLIGTQDMLLSRAMNRGYGASRARWPVEFGLLNEDALWVVDEVQLMDVGLATSAQLQTFRDQDCCKGFRPCFTWWMSATLQPNWLRTVDTDTPASYPEWIREPCEINGAERSGELWNIHKSVARDPIPAADTNAFAQRIIKEHTKAGGKYGRITLVVCNTVARACATFAELKRLGRADGLELVHSRFRPAERETWRERFLCREACTPDVDRIIVATQVVEAGVDVSADCLVTELAPWPSLVQRFGRCARYPGAGEGHILVIDRGRDEKSALPYSPTELNSAWEALGWLSDVGLASLEDFESALRPEERASLYPYDPAHLLLRHEFDELFDTTPDLTGADLDVSRFIRSGAERDLLVFWADLEKSEEPSLHRQPQRRELCAVPFLAARDWLCGEQTKSNRKPKLRKGMRAWVWDWIDGEWTPATRMALLPGRIVCVAAHCGGYHPTLGFSPDASMPVPTIQPPQVKEHTQALWEADSRQDAETLSVSRWKTIGYHSLEVAETVRSLAESLGLPPELCQVLVQAAHWHDTGKSHRFFQGRIKGVDRPSRPDLAKAPDCAWSSDCACNGDERPGFRHELASALALFALLEACAPGHPALLGPWAEALMLTGRQHPERPPESDLGPAVREILDLPPEDFDLVAYLVASHHGKVRAALHVSPRDQEYRDLDGRGLPIRGVREGDRLPCIGLGPDSGTCPELSLTLEPAGMGLSTRTGRSWGERCSDLLDRYGPAGLAYLEALLRAADVRASRLETIDPDLTEEVSA